MKEFKNIPANGKESCYYKLFMSLIWNKRKPEFLAGIAHLFLNLTDQCHECSIHKPGLFLFLRHTRMFPRWSYYIFSNTFLVSKIFGIWKCVLCIPERKPESRWLHLPGP